MTTRNPASTTAWRSPYRDRAEYDANPLALPTVFERRVSGTVHATGWWPPMLCLVARGRIQLLARRLHVPLNTGSLWVSEGGALHGLRAAPAGQAASLIVLLAPCDAAANKDQTLRRWSALAPLWFDLLLAPDAHVSRLARATLQEFVERDPGDRHPVSFEHLLHELRLQQGEIMSRLSRCPGRSEQHRLLVLSRLQRVRALLDANFRGELSLAEMARVAETSRVHFLRKFHHVFGATPFQYLDRRRINLVSELLADGRLSSQEIAQAYGFAGRSAFARWFRLRTGQSPESFRTVMQAGRGVRERVEISIDRLLGSWTGYPDPTWRTDRRKPAKKTDSAPPSDTAATLPRAARQRTRGK